MSAAGLFARLDVGFSHVARYAAHQVGRPQAFALAILATLVWAATGPLFGFSDTWQLIINTATTILTWLIVFLLQNSQNRDTAEILLKLDELVRATEGAANRLIELEDMTEDELERLRERIRLRARREGWP